MCINTNKLNLVKLPKSFWPGVRYSLVTTQRIDEDDDYIVEHLGRLVREGGYNARNRYVQRVNSEWLLDCRAYRRIVSGAVVCDPLCKQCVNCRVVRIPGTLRMALSPARSIDKGEHILASYGDLDYWSYYPNIVRTRFPLCKHRCPDVL